MEIICNLIYSNDPRIAYNIIYRYTGYGYYANHYTKIIKKGYFTSSSRNITGVGYIIKYSDDKIVINIGDFISDIPNQQNKILSTVDTNLYLHHGTKPYTKDLLTNPAHFQQKWADYYFYCMFKDMISNKISLLKLKVNNLKLIDFEIMHTLIDDNKIQQFITENSDTMLYMDNVIDTKIIKDFNYKKYNY